MKIKNITSFLDNLYPSSLASDFDQNKIGLVIGDDALEVKNILLSLDLTLEVVKEAISKNANLIICHHPFIFEPIAKILFNSKEGKILNLMFQEKISLYVMHTNLDVGENGVNDTLASLLKLTKITGVVAKDSFLRCGTTDITLQGLTNLVKNKFDLIMVRVVGPLDRLITRVGIVGGSGGQSEIIDEAITKGCDCLITGEIKLHIAQYAVDNDLCLIEVNHGVEKFVFNNLKEILKTNLNLESKIFISEINTDPLLAI